MPLWTDVFVIVIQIIRALDAMFFAYYVWNPWGDVLSAILLKVLATEQKKKQHGS